MLLNEIDENETKKVSKINSKGSMRTRLMDLGIIEGCSIKKLFISPFKDPIAFLIKGAVIAIRVNDCKEIEIE
ncbi:MAG: FeoA domain-containing protein [Clostridia bacterium]